MATKPLSVDAASIGKGEGIEQISEVVIDESGHPLSWWSGYGASFEQRKSYSSIFTDRVKKLHISDICHVSGERNITKCANLSGYRTPCRLSDRGLGSIKMRIICRSPCVLVLSSHLAIPNFIIFRRLVCKLYYQRNLSSLTIHLSK